MGNNSQHIEHLWRRYLAGQATEAELNELFEYNNGNPNDEPGSRFIEEILAAQPAEKRLNDEVRRQMLENVLAGRQKLATAPRIAKYRYLAAAVAIVAIALASLWYFNTGKQQTAQKPPVMAASDIQPGKNGAVLTLADGTKMILDSLGNGIIANQQGTSITLQEGALVYNHQQQTGEIAFNTMTTPAGRQFTLLLPDGSKVWLNASSSIRFPTAFSGKERLVELSGEAYFQVAADKSLPFHVKLPQNGEIEVLGTGFNVNGYANEKAITTTLVEGQIKVKQGTESKLLKPGQQAKIAANAVSLIKNANVEMITAWKNGVFNFEGLTLEEAMRQIERWYDVKVVYPEGIPSVQFGGEMDRNVSIDQLISILKKYGVKVQMQEGRIINILK